MLRETEAGKNIGIYSSTGTLSMIDTLYSFNIFFNILKKEIVMWTFHISNKTERCRKKILG